MSNNRVLVSGCFDMLHSGHVAFLEEAAAYGEVHVCIGSDITVHNIKNRWPVNDENERKYMLSALSCVHEVHISKGSGLLDFIDEFHHLQPETFVVNEDGQSPEKEALCREHGVKYVVLKREPHATLKPRSTTSIRSDVQIPFRIDLAGGWLDQPSVSKHYPGPVLTISVEPTQQFDDRSGMSSSTRHTAISLWGPRLPVGDLDRMAHVLFCCENPPGKAYVSGSQDSIGIVYPGLNRINYDGKFWPTSIDSIYDEDVLSFLEDHLQLIQLFQRPPAFNVLEGTNITEGGAKRLAEAADQCWVAAQTKDAEAFGKGFTKSFEAQIEMYPNMVTPEILAAMQEHGQHAFGYKLSGAGGGGYIILFRKDDYPGATRIKIRRRGE